MDVCDVENRIQIVSNTHTHTHKYYLSVPIYLIIDRNIQYILYNIERQKEGIYYRDDY